MSRIQDAGHEPPEGDDCGCGRRGVADLGDPPHPHLQTITVWATGRHGSALQGEGHEERSAPGVGRGKEEVTSGVEVNRWSAGRVYGCTAGCWSSHGGVCIGGMSAGRKGGPVRRVYEPRQVEKEISAPATALHAARYTLLTAH